MSFLQFLEEIFCLFDKRKTAEIHTNRALLEAYEELCRLGIWDFAVDLSGADLPLRSMEDLSLALAPLRNQSFMAFHGLGYKNAPYQMDTDAMKGLLLG